MNKPLPTEFVNTINLLLDKDAPLFWKALESDPAVSGLRINPIKTTFDNLQQDLAAVLSPLPWTDYGYLISEGEGLGKHPFHAAGLYYLQEPSAMVPVSILDPKPGEIILDLCAAPGGKTTQIHARMKDKGLLVANDANPRRVQALGRNIERWGARNTMVLCETPQRLYDHFGAYFDRVLVDAPCSGEGTFRSDPGEIKKWSPGFSARCATIQDELLWYAGKMVRPGGVLVYSTCTFNQLENEGAILRFLEKDPGFTIETGSHTIGFSKGIPLSNTLPVDFSQTTRVWPHLVTGEGHFVARLRKTNIPSKPASMDSHLTSNVHKDQMEAYEIFFKNTLHKNSNTDPITPGNTGLRVYGNRLYWLSTDHPSPIGLRVHHWGWWLGTFKTDRFIPSPALASSITREDAQKVLEFSLGDPELVSYLRGSPFSYSSDEKLIGSWILVTVAGYPLGWGKIQKGRVKSYFPNWLRSN